MGGKQPPAGCFPSLRVCVVRCVGHALQDSCIGALGLGAFVYLQPRACEIDNCLSYLGLRVTARFHREDVVFFELRRAALPYSLVKSGSTEQAATLGILRFIALNAAMPISDLYVVKIEQQANDCIGVDRLDATHVYRNIVSICGMFNHEPKDRQSIVHLAADAEC